MIWDPAITITPDFDLIFLSDISLSITRTDSLTGVRSSLAIARPEAEAETLQPLITDAQPASPDSLTSRKIFSQDPVTNWRSTEGQAIGGSRGTQINGAGTYTPLIFADNQQFPDSETIEQAEAIGNGIEITTTEGLQYRLAQQGTGVLNVSDNANKFAITIKRLGQNLNGFALYQVDPETGSVTLNGQTFSPVQPGYTNAALASAAASQLVFNTDLMPGYDEEITLRDIVLSPGTEYGVLFFNDTRTTAYSSYAAANPGYAVQVQSYLPDKDNQLVFALEDLSNSDPNCDRDYNDLILTIEQEPTASFDQLTVFGDSLSDFGSRSAAMYKQVLQRDAVPPWSGSTFSNAQDNWQTQLRTSLSIPYDSVTGAGITNSFVGGLPSPIPASSENPSYAVGGALSGKDTLYDVLANLNPPKFPPVLLGPPYSVSGLGVQSQIEQALTVENQSLINNLVTLWSGGNDLLAAVNQGKTLSETLMDVLDKTKASLITLLRSGDARSVLVSSIAPLQGDVDGVAYAMPFIKALPPEWQAAIEAGAANLFRGAVLDMVENVKEMFPYAALVNFNNEYGFNWKRFGSELGNFSDYGVTQTTQSSQANQATDPNQYLYFDDVHPTESGHQMIAKAIELTLEAEQSSLDAAFLNDTIVADSSVATGSWLNDAITAANSGSQLNGLEGNDWLKGLNGADDLNGGDGNDLLDGAGGINALNGGLGADTFEISTASLNGGIQTIKDFDATEGDRLLLSQAYAEAIGDFFFVPTEQDWQHAVSFQSTDQGGLLTVHFTDPNVVDGLIALNGVQNFNTAWLS